MPLTTIDGNSITIGTVNEDRLISPYVNISGDTMTGSLQLPENGLTIGNNQFIVTSSGIGINTDTPAYTLDVNGDFRVTGTITSNNFSVLSSFSTNLLSLSSYGSSSSPAITFSGAGNTGIYLNNFGNLTFSAGGTDAISVENGRIVNYTNDYSYSREGFIEPAIQYDSSLNRLNLGSGSSYLSFWTNGSPDRIYISDDGKVGINTTLLDSNSILSVSGGVYSQDGYKGLKITDIPGVTQVPEQNTILVGTNTANFSVLNFTDTMYSFLQAGTGIALSKVGEKVIITNTGGGGGGSVSAGVSSITGSDNQIFVSNPDGDVILSLPQDIASNSNVTFNTVTAASFTGSGTGLNNIPNQALQNYGITLNTTNGISGGGPVYLGETITLSNTGVTSVFGTSNQIIVSQNTGNVTFSLPQNIHSGASPTFNSLSLTNPLSIVNGGTGLTAVGNTSTVLTSIGSGATWSIIPGEIALKRYYVTQNGSDTNDGLSIKYAFASIKYALQKAALDGTPSIIYVSSGEFILDNSAGPVTIPENCSLVGDSVRQTIVRPSTNGNGLFYFESGIYLANFAFRDKLNPNGSYAGTWSWVGQFKPNAIIRQSPYVQNCSIISGVTPDNVVLGQGGNGLLANGAVLNSNTVLKSMVANAFTIVSSNGIGYQLENNAYMQLVSIFTIFCDKGVYTKSGSYASVSNSANNFGNYGLYSEGFSPTAFNSDIGTIVGTGNAYSSELRSNVSYINISGLGRFTGNNQLNYIVKLYGSGGTEDVTGTYFDGYGTGNSEQVFVQNIVGSGSSSENYSFYLSKSFSTGSSIPTDGSISVKLFRPSIINGSNCTWEYVGSGTTYGAFPERSTFQLTDSQKTAREQYDYTSALFNGETGKTNANYGRIYASGTNEFGDFKVGKLINANNRYGYLTFSGNILLSRVVSFRFSSGEDLEVNSFSSDAELGGALSSNNTIPTQKSVLTFATNKLGQLFNKIPTTGSGSSYSNGNYLVQLNGQGKIDLNQIPALPLYNTFSAGSTSDRYQLSVVNTSVKVGDIVLQSGTGTSNISNWIVKQLPTNQINLRLQQIGSSNLYVDDQITIAGTGNTATITSISGSGITWNAVALITSGYFGVGITVQKIGDDNTTHLITSLDDNFQRLDTNTSTIDASSIVSGTISPQRLGSGLVNSNTFLSGNSTYQYAVKSIALSNSGDNPINLVSAIYTGSGISTQYSENVTIDINRVSKDSIDGNGFSNVGVAKFDTNYFDVSSGSVDGKVSLKIIPLSKGGFGQDITGATGLVRFNSGTLSFDTKAFPTGNIVGTTDSQTINNKIFGSGNTWNGGIISLAYGGTGATSQSTAANNILPSQSTNSGKYLTTDGNNVSWNYPVTNISAGTGISVTPNVGGGVTISFDNSAIISSLNVGQSTITTSDISISGTGTTAIDTFSNTTYRSAKYIIQMSSTGSGTTTFQSSELLLIHDGTTVYQTVYANIVSSSTLGVIDSDISGGNVRLLLTPTYSDTKIRVYRTCIKTY